MITNIILLILISIGMKNQAMVFFPKENMMKSLTCVDMFLNGRKN